MKPKIDRRLSSYSPILCAGEHLYLKDADICYIDGVALHTCTRVGGVSTPPPSRRKMYRVGGEKREKGKKRGKIRQKGNIRLKIEKSGENRRKSSNLAKNRYKLLKIVSSYTKNRNHRDLT